MKSFVITVMHNQRSLDSAIECIESCKKFGFEPQLYPAFTPKDNPHQVIDDMTGRKCYSRLKYEPRPECVAGTLASQMSLWYRCAADNEDYLILEHDARMVNPLPTEEYDGCMTLGKPSWGHPPPETKTGVQYLPEYTNFYGNHAILMKPEGARKILSYFSDPRDERPVLDPADMFLAQHRFPFLQKYVPYPFIVEDNFSLIQQWGQSVDIKTGINKDTYEVIDPDEDVHYSNNS